MLGCVIGRVWSIFDMPVIFITASTKPIFSDFFFFWIRIWWWSHKLMVFISNPWSFSLLVLHSFHKLIIHTIDLKRWWQNRGSWYGGTRDRRRALTAVQSVKVQAEVRRWRLHIICIGVSYQRSSVTIISLAENHWQTRFLKQGWRTDQILTSMPM